MSEHQRDQQHKSVNSEQHRARSDSITSAGEIDWQHLQRALADPNMPLRAETVLQLQRLIGNHAVGRLLQQRQPAITPAPSTTIQRSKHQQNDEVNVLLNRVEVKHGKIISVVNDDTNESLVIYRVQYTKDNTIENVPGYRVFPDYFDPEDIIEQALNMGRLKDTSEQGIYTQLGLDQEAEDSEYTAVGDLNTQPAQAIPVDQRPVVRIVMNQGHVDYLNQVRIWNDESLQSCSLIIMFNAATGVGALYHFPAGSLKTERKKIEHIFGIVTPTYVKLIHSKNITRDFVQLEMLFSRNLGIAPVQEVGGGATGITLAMGGGLEIFEDNPGNEIMTDVNEFPTGIASFY